MQRQDCKIKVSKIIGVLLSEWEADNINALDICVTSLMGVYDGVAKKLSAWDVVDRTHFKGNDDKFLVMKPKYDEYALAGVIAFIKKVAEKDKQTAHDLYDMMGIEDIDTEQEYIIKFLVQESDNKRSKISFKCDLGGLCQNNESCQDGTCNFLKKE